MHLARMPARAPTAGNRLVRTIRRFGLIAGAVLLGGCYTLQPLGGTAPAPGTQIALDVTDAGRVALGGQMGPEVSQIEGRLVSRDSGEYLVAVSLVHLLRGGEQTWKGEQVRVKSDLVSRVYERRFSKGRSLAMGAIGVGAVAIIASQGLLAGGTTDPTKNPPDTSASSRRPKR